MDVRCEKCQTEYELDEARLKPSGVTVKCTQCGHMFKIRKRANTNVGAPPATDPRVRPPSKPNRVEAAVSAAAIGLEDDGAPTTIDRERNWLIRLDNGEQRSCRELAVLQQWIVAGSVTRESLISRSGKTWKRLGDIAELTQYFSVADEARTRRAPTNEPATKQVDLRATMLGVSAVTGFRPSSAGGTILPDDDDEVATTGSFRTPPSMPPPPGARTPAMGVVTRPPATVPAGATTPPMGVATKAPARPITKVPPIPSLQKPTPPPNAGKPKPPSMNETLKPPSINQTLAAVPPPPQLLAAQPIQPMAIQPMAIQPTAMPATAQMRPTPPPAPRPTASPPPAPPPVAVVAPPVVAAPQAAPQQPPRATPPQSPPPPAPGAEASMGGLPVLSGPMPAGNRATAAWATDAIRPDDDMADQGPSGPVGGRIGAIPNEPAFAGRVRAEPVDASVFAGKVTTSFDDDDDVLPPRRGSKAGLIIAVASLLVIGGAVAVVYLFVLKQDNGTTAKAPVKDAAVQVASSADASAPVVTPLVDAAVAVDPLVAARNELGGDVESRLKTALDGLAGKDDPASLAVRARLDAALAQDLADRATLTTDRAEADKLRKDSRQLVLDALPLAQHALAGAQASGDANLAMADVLRLQGKPAAEVKRAADKARTERPRDAALEDALVLARDGKLDDARNAFATIDQGDGRLEASGDVRARFHLALTALAQNKPDDAKPLVDQVLAAKPEHVAARALSAKLDTIVARTDPLPPEDHRDAGVPAGSAQHPDQPVIPHPPIHPGNPPAGNDEAAYDAAMAAARKIGDSNCSKAMELYQKALDIKPSSVEALSGQGSCHLDAKEFSQAYKLFHAALLYSPTYEPALAGIAEMYQLQGNKERAVEAWNAYLAVYPGSPKAQKHLEQLGVTSGGSTPPTGGSATAPPATPPATPPAQPPTTPESGSSS